MNIACRNFTSSKVTKREIGTKFLQSKLIKIGILREEQNPSTSILNDHQRPFGLPSTLACSKTQILVVLYHKCVDCSKYCTDKATNGLDTEHDNDLFVSQAINFAHLEASTSRIHHDFRLMSCINHETDDPLSIS